MLKIDEFESVFRSAIKQTYQHKALAIRSVLLVTDLDAGDTAKLLIQVKRFCRNLNKDSDLEIKWDVALGEDFSNAESLLKLTQSISPDLIITYRNLHSETWKHPFSLGEQLDVLLQKTALPVLVIPHPKADFSRDKALDSCGSVMVATDHMVNDHHLIQHGVMLVDDNCQFYLTHIEDQFSFDRVIDAISKIPTVDTEEVKLKLAEQLLKEPTEYIESVKSVLKSTNRKIEVTPIVQFGHQMKDYLKFIDQYQVSLLVINTKDGDQMAMHGLAYPLAIEVRQIPILML